MTDIIERLRRGITEEGALRVMDEAADKIERLQAALKGLVDAADYDSQDSGWYSMQSIEALEIARRALEQKP